MERSGWPMGKGRHCWPTALGMPRPKAWPLLLASVLASVLALVLALALARARVLA